MKNEQFLLIVGLLFLILGNQSLNIIPLFLSAFFIIWSLILNIVSREP